MIQHGLRGLEFDWLAVDAIGHVGWFWTAGGGNAPTDVVARIEGHAAAIDAIAKIAPTTRPVERLGEGELSQAGARGVFVFDSSFHADPYQRMVTPVVPALITDLPASLAIARRVRIRGDFRELAKIPQQLIDELG